MNKTQGASGRSLLAVLLVAFPGGVQIAKTVSDGAPGRTAAIERVADAKREEAATERPTAPTPEAAPDPAEIAEAFERAAERAERRAARDQEQFLSRLADADARRRVEERAPAPTPPPPPVRRVAPAQPPVVEDDGTVLQPTSTNPAPPTTTTAPASADAVKRVEAAENTIK